jgi:hypothetical protein
VLKRISVSVVAIGSPPLANSALTRQLYFDSTAKFPFWASATASASSSLFGFVSCE